MNTTRLEDDFHRRWYIFWLLLETFANKGELAVEAKWSGNQKAESALGSKIVISLGLLRLENQH